MVLKLDAGEHIDWSEMDVHPPTYYWYLAVWHKLNPGVDFTQWLRIFSLVLMAGFVLLAGLWLYRHYEEKPAGMTLLLLSIASTYLHYGTEARSYALMLFLVALGINAYDWMLIVVDEIYWLSPKGPLLLFVVLFAILILPNVHYYSGFIGACFICMYVLFRTQIRSGWKSALVVALVLLVFLGAGTSNALGLALEQKARGDGMWFQPPSLQSWPSSMIYGWFHLEQVGTTDAPMFYHDIVTLSMFLFVVLILWFAYRLLKEKRIDNRYVFRVSALVALVLPMVGLLLAPLLGGDGFAHLYHHRFFLVVMWFAFIVVMVELFTSLKKVVWRNMVFILCIAIFLFLSYLYMITSHHELDRVMQATPCVDKYVLHESPFSALPSIIDDYEVGCTKKKHIVSTKISPRQAATAGFDALNSDQIYWNLTLPNVSGFYYYKAAGIVIVAEDGSYRKLEDWDFKNVTTVYEDDGINLTWVSRR